VEKNPSLCNKTALNLNDNKGDKRSLTLFVEKMVTLQCGVSDIC